MIDLHTHTQYSDGSDTVSALLDKAQSHRLSLLSITDHNTVEAYFDEAIKDKSKYFKGQLIPGVEITTIYKGEIVEVLGYGFDVNKMRELLHQNVLSFKDKQEKEFKLIKEIYHQRNFVFNQENLSFDSTKESSRKAFWKELMNYPENVERLSVKSSIEKSSLFTRQEVYNPQSDYYVDQSSLYPSLKKTVEIIHEAGGIALLAHLYIYKNADKFYDELPKIVSTYQLDGVECFYSTFTAEQSERLVKLAKQHNWLMSGGSDYHGSRKPDIVLNHSQVEESVIDNWPETIKLTKF